MQATRERRMILISKTDSERVIGRKDAYNRACAIADGGTDAGVDEHAIIDAILTGLADLIAEPIRAAPEGNNG